MTALVNETESFKYQKHIVVGMWSEEEATELRDMYPDTPNKVIADKLGRNKPQVEGKAQRMGLEKDRRASRLYETRRASADYPTNDDAFANYVCGFVDGEGSFICRKNGDGRSFSFSIEVVESDEDIIREIADFFGVGHVYTHKEKKEGWQRTVQYQVSGADAIARTIIPFFKHYGLRAELKEEQFETFEKEFHDYFNLEPKPLSGNIDNKQS